MRTLLSLAVGVSLATSSPATAQPPDRLLRDDGFAPDFVKSGVLQDGALSGGLNAPQFSRVDLDGDGADDLYVFDRAGEAHLGFRAAEGDEAGEWVYDASLTAGFPDVRHWCFARDYNGDGVVDLFTSSADGNVEGIFVYTGAVAGTGLTFARAAFANSIDGALNFDTPGGDQGLVYVARTDIPAIEDLDGDGDLDILSFGSSGSYVKHYENVGPQRGDAPLDFLRFRLASECYGGALEAATDGTVTLADVPGTCPNPARPPNRPQRGALHPGSTVFAGDVDGDGDVDALLGDIEADFVTQLTNDPADGEAFFTSADPTWPSAATPVALDFFPAVYRLSAADAPVEYVVSPNSGFAGEDYEVAWRYAPDETGELSLVRRDFLVRRMLDHGSGSRYALGDLSGDGIDDVIVGNESIYDADDPQGPLSAELTYYAYDADAGAYVEREPRWLALLNDAIRPSLLNLDPVLYDMDADGDLDLLIGNASGEIAYAENNGSAAATNFAPVRLRWQFLDAGVNSSPAVADLSGDGLPDLLVGERSGALRLYVNQGAATAPDFDANPTEAAFAGIDTRVAGENDFAGPRPAFLESEDGPVLFVATRNGLVRSYGNVSAGEQAGEPVTSEVGVGARADVAFGTDPAGATVAFVGSIRGGLGVFRPGDVTPTRELTTVEPTWRVAPNPSTGRFALRGVPPGSSVRVYDMRGRVRHVAQDVDASLDVDLEGAAAGLYTVQVVGAQGREASVRRVVVK